MTPSYAVIIPTFNAASTLSACLQSVLAQMLLPEQVIVVDDCSNDASLDCVASFADAFERLGIHLQSFETDRNSGPSVARNRGLLAASTTHVAFLDADDTWAPEKLHVIDGFIRSHDPAVLGHVHSVLTDSARTTTGGPPVEARWIGCWQLLWRNVVQTSCVVVRRDCRPVFDETMRHCEDYDLWLRLADRKPLLMLSNAYLTKLGRPQLSSGGLSENRLRMRCGELRAYFGFATRHFPLRLPILPALVVLSLLKHVVSLLKARAL